MAPTVDQLAATSKTLQREISRMEKFLANVTEDNTVIYNHRVSIAAMIDRLGRIKDAVDANVYAAEAVEMDKRAAAIAEIDAIAQQHGLTVRAVSKPRPVARGRNETVEIRRWAAANGYSVSSRGRLPESILGAYRDAS